MKRKKYSGIFLTAGIISMMMIGCAPDDPNDTVSLPSDRFIGTWSMESHHTDPNQAATQYWTLIIESAASGEQVAMKNFDQTGNNKIVYANINGNNLTIPTTTVNLDGGGQQRITGTGNLNSGILSFQYTSFDGLVTDTATAISQ